MARAYSDALGAELAIVAKHRVNATHVEAMNVIGDVEGPIFQASLTVPNSTWSKVLG